MGGIVTLSPFTVTASTDTGYQAAYTLAGTRLNAPVKDLGSSIYTKDFLQDIGATNYGEWLIFATGMEAASAGGNFSGATDDIISSQVFANGPRVDLQQSSRTRGLAAPNPTRGFSTSSIAFDGYNAERVTGNRGPNTILFGVGSPAGVVDTSLLSPGLPRNPNKNEGRYGNNDSLRSLVDFDGVLIDRKLTLRLVLLPFFGAGDLIGAAAGTEEVIRRLEKIAPRPEEASGVFGIESWLKVPEMERNLDAVKSPALKVYYDVGNMQKVGEFASGAIRRLGRERFCEIHLKELDDLYGKGLMNFKGVRLALDDIGYRGWLGLEGVKTPLGVEPCIRYDLDYLRPIFPKSV